MGLSCDCNEKLCGCCWCPCSGDNYSDICPLHPLTFEPSEDDEDCPGEFSASFNNSVAITINIRTDDYPEDTTFQWSIKEESGLREILDDQSPTNASAVNNYTHDIDAESLYRLQLFDGYGDGTCCESGLGWFTMTSSTPSDEHDEGSVVREVTGDDLVSSLDVFIWVDSQGNALVLQYFPGEGHGLIENGSLEGEYIVLVPNSSNIFLH